MSDVSYKTDKKSLFFTSLGDFTIDRFQQQFIVQTNSCHLGQIFHHDFQSDNIIIVYKTEILSLQMQFFFTHCSVNLNVFLLAKLLEKATIF